MIFICSSWEIENTERNVTMDDQKIKDYMEKATSAVETVMYRPTFLQKSLNYLVLYAGFWRHWVIKLLLIKYDNNFNLKKL